MHAGSQEDLLDDDEWRTLRPDVVGGSDGESDARLLKTESKRSA